MNRKERRAKKLRKRAVIMVYNHMWKYRDIPMIDHQRYAAKVLNVPEGKLVSREFLSLLFQTNNPEWHVDKIPIEYFIETNK